MTKSKDTNIVIETRIHQAEDFIKTMDTIDRYMEVTNDEFSPNGKYYNRAREALKNYAIMKHKNVEFVTNISVNQCLREIRNRGEGIFDYYLTYEDLPEENSREYPTMANIYDVYDLCNDTFMKKEFERFIESRKLCFDVILSSFFEQILLDIKDKRPDLYIVLYAEYFNAATIDQQAKVKWEYCGMRKDTYYNNIKAGTKLFAKYLFSPYSEIYINNDTDEKHVELIEHLKQAAILASELLQQREIDKKTGEDKENDKNNAAES